MATQEVQLPKGGFNPSMFDAMKGDVKAPPYSESAAATAKAPAEPASKPEPKRQPDFSEEIAENLKKHEEELAKKEQPPKKEKTESPPKKEESRVKEPEEDEEIPEEDEEEIKKQDDEGESEEEASDTSTEGEGTEPSEPGLRPLDIKGKGTTTAKTEQQELDEFPDELKPFAKQMARPARQKILAELKRRDKVIEESKAATTHPLLVEGAYQLDNNYQASAKVAQSANTELAYWKAQRAAIRAGNDWNNLQVGADGKLVQIPQKASQEGEDFVNERIAEAAGLVRQHSATMNYIQQNYKNIVTEGLKGVAQIEDQLFPQFRDEKSITGHPHHKALQTILMQKGMVHLVPSSMFTKLFLAAQDAFSKIDELESKLKGQETPAPEEGEVEETVKPKPQPTSRNFKGGVGKRKPGASEPGFDANAFEKLKNR